MPEELRETLGIDSFNRKKARDSFLLTALLHSRNGKAVSPSFSPGPAAGTIL